jgi:thioredoxin reductase (NADPH)
MDRPLMLGTAWCGDCKRAKQFFAEQRLAYDYVDIDGDDEARRRVEELNDGKSIIPTILLPDGRILVEPSNAELAAAFGIAATAERAFYDLIVIGSGPAGLTAALYAAREGIDTLVIERGGVGGQAGVTERLDNFPGFPEGVTGTEFAERLRAQALRFGVELLGAAEAAGLHRDGEDWAVALGDGTRVRAHAVLLATGSTYRRLGVPGEDDLIGAGIHFCATCDGAFYRDRDLLVIGGGNSAGEEGLFLTKFARSVTLVTQDPALSASRVVADKVLRHPAMTVRTGTRPIAFIGDGALSAVVVEEIATGNRQELTADGVFVFIGLSPNSALADELLAVDERGFVVTDAAMSTTERGIFAAGDVRAGSTKQAASAAGEGAAAALAIRRYLEERGAQQTVDATRA